jgi:hypothetical protein
MYENAGPVWSPTPAGPQQQADPRYGGPPHPPSGLFPIGPARPTYREPHPIRGAALAAGVSGAAAWLLLFGLLGRDLPGYAWWTIIAGGVAWLVALLLARLGDRGVAAGIAITTALGWAVAATAVAARWATTADWPLW